MPHSKGFGRRRDARSTDPVAIGEVVDRLLEEELFSRGIPIATLASKWPQIVGDRMAEATAPASLEGKILTIRASDGPWGSQARYLAREIRDRADAALGGDAVTSVRVVLADPRNRSSEG